MIYYFSGTGNSLKVAQQLAAITSQSLSAMTEPEATGDDTIGLVFPVYAWGMPKVVRDFVLNKLPGLLKGKSPYLYAVMTCGDDMGYTDRLLGKLLDEYCHIRLSAAFSVHMPNTYVCLPGFDVDDEDKAKGKIQATMAQLPAIAEAVKGQESVVKVVRGAMPWTKSYILRPLFNWALTSDKHFHTDNSLCTRCGKCVKTCPMHNISLDGDGIHWHHHCTDCLACYHCCPKHAINYGSQTQKKGQKEVWRVV